MVISYAYLWRREHDQGRDSGAKTRPAVIVLIAKDMEGETIVIVAPITHSAPSSPDDAIEIPAATKARLGLDRERSWVMISEVNRFVWPGPDLAPLSGKQRRFDGDTARNEPWERRAGSRVRRGRLVRCRQ